MEATQLAVATAIVLPAAVLQGSVGFGYALVAAPLLLLIDARLVPGPLIFSAFALVLMTALRERGHIDSSGVGWTLVGRLPGTVLGALAVGAIPASAMAIPVGASVLLAVVLSASGWHLRPTRWTLVGAGTVSGFMGTTSSIGGPPLAVVYQHSPGPELRSPLAMLFMIGSVLSITALAIVGRFGKTELGLSLLLVPGTLLGFALSGRLTPWVDRGYTRPAVLVVSAAAGLLVLARELL